MSSTTTRRKTLHTTLPRRVSPNISNTWILPNSWGTNWCAGEVAKLQSCTRPTGTAFSAWIGNANEIFDDIAKRSCSTASAYLTTTKHTTNAIAPCEKAQQDAKTIATKAYALSLPTSSSLPAGVGTTRSTRYASQRVPTFGTRIDQILDSADPSSSIMCFIESRSLSIRTYTPLVPPPDADRGVFSLTKKSCSTRCRAERYLVLRTNFARFTVSNNNLYSTVTPSSAPCTPPPSDTIYDTSRYQGM